MKCHFPKLPTDAKALRLYVAEQDADFESRLQDLSERIASSSELKLIGLTGPTCAGKTTAAKKLTAALEQHGHRVHVISIDDFYYDKEILQKRADDDPDIEIDYDSEDTIDISLLTEKTKSLLKGDPTQMPRFDFPSGCRLQGQLLDPDPTDVFLFEGIQLLYPKIHAILNGPSYHCIYICASSAIELNGVRFEPNEIRLMRRLVRDYRYRASKPDFTLYLWQSVRANEEKNIFPNAHRCHDVIDSTMPYEIGMLKPYLEEILLQMEPSSPYFGQAEALLDKLRSVSAVPSEYMTENSLYKEFI
ncbi:MAG: hypothetical protein J6B71_07790 [Clostridia bacterium]|nr:hypothetical protein [Clostridia bacterium]